MADDTRRLHVRDIQRLKGERPVVCVTAYDALMAHFADAAGVDLILVGDSLGTTVLGFETTVPVTLDMMAHHSAAVSRGCRRAFQVADLPFGVAQESPEAALRASMRLMQEGAAHAVKLEGGREMATTVTHLGRAGIPVMGHIGLHPQHVHRLGGYRRFGKTDDEVAALLADAQALEGAGVFAIIGEMVAPDAARQITAATRVPFIGIGCGPDCDGQIIVSTDMLGMNPGKPPSFVKEFAGVGAAMKAGFRAYTEAVRDKRFPT